jgi:hypothetical protein
MSVSKKEIDSLSTIIDGAWQYFCCWRYLQNKRYNPVYSRKNSNGLESRYTNFWKVVIVALQNEFCLAIARLIDSPEYKKRKRLSLKYFIENSGDIGIKLTKKLQEQEYDKYQKAIKKFRDEKLGHNDLDTYILEGTHIIPGKTEDFFELLESFIKEIISSDTGYKDCRAVNLKDSEEISKKGIENIFKDLGVK